MFSVGLFHNRDVLSIVMKTIRQRNDHMNPLANNVMRRHRKYYLFLLNSFCTNLKKRNIFFSSYRPNARSRR